MHLYWVLIAETESRNSKTDIIQKSLTLQPGLTRKNYLITRAKRARLLNLRYRIRLIKLDLD